MAALVSISGAAWRGEPKQLRLIRRPCGVVQCEHVKRSNYEDLTDTLPKDLRCEMETFCNNSCELPLGLNKIEF